MSDLGFFWLGAADLCFFTPRNARRCRKLRRNEGPRDCATAKPTKSCQGVLTPWPAAFRSSSMISCLYFAGITFALTAPLMTPRERWPWAVHRSSLRLLCHHVQNVDARSARHLHIASNVSREILDFLEAKMCSCKRHSMSSKCVSPLEAKELILRAARYKRNIKCSARETVNT